MVFGCLGGVSRLGESLQERCFLIHRAVYAEWRRLWRISARREKHTSGPGVCGETVLLVGSGGCTPGGLAVVVAGSEEFDTFHRGERYPLVQREERRQVLQPSYRR